MNTVIKNGTILQGAGNGYKSHAIYFGQINYARNCEIANVKSTVQGPASVNIAAYYHYGYKIHDNVLTNNVRIISSRHQQEGALIDIGANNAVGDQIYRNTLIGGAQIGIRAGNQNTQIFENKIGRASCRERVS
jgi:hypothetical protein